MNRFISLCQEWLEGIDYELKKFLQRDPITNDEVIMELYREISMQYVLSLLHDFRTGLEFKASAERPRILKTFKKVLELFLKMRKRPRKSSEFSSSSRSNRTFDGSGVKVCGSR